MKCKSILCLMAFGVGCNAPVYSQKWLKNLGKVLNEVVETTANTPNTTTSQRGNGTQPASSGKAKADTPNVPHVTSSTIEITVPDFTYKYGQYSEGYVVIKDKQKETIGIFNVKGEPQVSWSIPFKENELPRFDSGVIPLKGMENYQTTVSIVNTKGETLARYTNLAQAGTNFYGGLFTMIRKVKASGNRQISSLRYVDASGKEVFPALWQDLSKLSYNPQLKDARPFCDDLSCYYDYMKERYGYFDRQGKIVIPAQFTSAEDFSEGRAVVSTDGERWFYIDTTGKQCIEQTFVAAKPQSFHDGYALVYKRNGNAKSPCFIDTTGQVVTNMLVNATSFMGGYACVEMNDGVYTVDKKFNKVRDIQSAMGSMLDFKIYPEQGLICVDDDVYAADGTLIFRRPFEYEMGKFHDGVAFIESLNEGWTGYVDAKGKVLIRFKQSDF